MFLLNPVAMPTTVGMWTASTQCDYLRLTTITAAMDLMKMALLRRDIQMGEFRLEEEELQLGGLTAAVATIREKEEQTVPWASSRRADPPRRTRLTCRALQRVARPGQLPDIDQVLYVCVCVCVCVYRAGVICVNVYTVYNLSVDLQLQFLRCRGLDNRDLLYLPLPKSLLTYIYSNLSFIFFFVQMNRVAVATGLVGAILTVSGLAPVQRITMQPPVLGM